MYAAPIITTSRGRDDSQLCTMFGTQSLPGVDIGWELVVNRDDILAARDGGILGHHGHPVGHRGNHCNMIRV